jgi:hypothetical protein
MAFLQQAAQQQLAAESARGECQCPQFLEASLQAQQ